jgi:hypothetical protein
MMHSPDGFDRCYHSERPSTLTVININWRVSSRTPPLYSASDPGKYRLAKASSKKIRHIVKRQVKNYIYKSLFV